MPPPSLREQRRIYTSSLGKGPVLAMDLVRCADRRVGLGRRPSIEPHIFVSGETLVTLHAVWFLNGITALLQPLALHTLESNVTRTVQRKKNLNNNELKIPCGEV